MLLQLRISFSFYDADFYDAFGDTESNPGSIRYDFRYNFLVCYWNLICMTEHNLEKIKLFESYDTINKFDVIWLSESYLDPYIASDNNDLNIKHSKLHRLDHPNNVKRDGVCAYIRESLPARCLGNTYL